MRSKFWMVLGGVGSPTWHDSKESAKTEAERLARACPGGEFTVLESLATVVKSDLVWEKNGHETTDNSTDVPF